MANGDPRPSGGFDEEAGVLSDVRWIDPSLASELLENLRIRPGVPRPWAVTDLARQMGRGDWRLNGEAIVFDERGYLVNGRKRLLACVESASRFRTLVVYGVPTNAGVSIDARHVRRVADVLLIGGRAGHRDLAAALRHSMCMRRGRWNPVRASSRQMLQILDANPSIGASVAFVRGVGVRHLPGLMGCLHHLFARVDASAADGFFRKISRSGKLSSSAPERMVAARFEGAKAAGERLSHREAAGIVIKAWNATRRGGILKTLRLRSTDSFPKVDGLPDAWALIEAGNGGPGQSDLEGPTAELAIVTPAMARTLLARAPMTRAPLRRAVGKLARDMVGGRWELNGETIKIGRNGALLDGRQRLAACVAAGLPFSTLIAWNVDEATFDTIDLGEARGYHTLLSDRGGTRTAKVAAAARLLWRLAPENAGSEASHSELDTLMTSFPSLPDSVDAVRKMGRVMPPSAAAACHVMFHRLCPTTAEQFFSKLQSGVGITSTQDPVHRLRERLLGAARGDRVGPKAALALSIKSWNAARQGRSLERLGWSPRERVPDPV